MKCQRKEENLEKCNCSYPGCPRKGICCLCISHHKEKDQLPACYFSDKVEKSYDRSIKNFVENYDR